jgi:hypothetical protein
MMQKETGKLGSPAECFGLKTYALATVAQKKSAANRAEQIPENRTHDVDAVGPAELGP